MPILNQHFRFLLLKRNKISLIQHTQKKYQLKWAQTHTLCFRIQKKKQKLDSQHQKKGKSWNNSTAAKKMRKERKVKKNRFLYKFLFDWCEEVNNQILVLFRFQGIVCLWCPQGGSQKFLKGCPKVFLTNFRWSFNYKGDREGSEDA